MTQHVTFFCAGDAASQGSKRGFARGGKVVLVEMSKKLGPWRERVAAEAHNAMKGKPPMEGPLVMRASFSFLRPASHYGSRKGVRYLKRNAPSYKATTPDLSKMIRAIEDAMSKIVYVDDRQVAEIAAMKYWTDKGQPGVQITVESLAGAADA